MNSLEDLRDLMIYQSSKMKIVTAYYNPDMDGVSCMYAYSELLNKQGKNAKYYIWGNPKKEVQIVCDIFKINLESIKPKEIPENHEYVIVDLNGKEQLPDIVKIEDVVEIVDHHGLSKWIQSYTNIQRLQIDKIGAAATIVAERYKESGLVPSRESAILLFYGIISNSINLKSNITKQRDKDACEWLKQVCKDILDEKIKEIFIKKSNIEDCDLRAEMECEIANVFPDFKVIVAQLEIANLEDFLKKRKKQIVNIMQTVKKEKKIEYMFINCVDILNGYIIIFAADEESEKFITDTYGYKFEEDNIIKVNKIIQRKDLTTILRKKYNPKIV